MAETFNKYKKVQLCFPFPMAHLIENTWRYNISSVLLQICAVATNIKAMRKYFSIIFVYDSNPHSNSFIQLQT
jgi:hypothetical protein